MCFGGKPVVAKVALSASPKIQPNSLTRETIHGQKEHCIICRSLQGSTPLPQDSLLPRNSMSQTELFAPLPVLNILGLVWVNRKELWHKVQFNQPPNRKALITRLKASFVQMATAEHDELKKKEKKKSHTGNMTGVHLCTVQTAGRHYCLLYLLSQPDLVGLPGVRLCTIFIKTECRGRHWLALERQRNPHFSFACKPLALTWNPSLLNMTFEKSAQGEVHQLIFVNGDSYSSRQELQELSLPHAAQLQGMQITYTLHWHQGKQQQHSAALLHSAEFRWPFKPIAFFNSEASWGVPSPGLKDFRSVNLNLISRNM